MAEYSAEAEASVSDTAADAATDTAQDILEEGRAPTTQDAENIAGPAAGAGAAAACAATGVGAVASPLCYWAGDKIGRWLTRTFARWFGKSDEMERYERRRKAVRADIDANLYCNGLDVVIGERLVQLTSNMYALYAELYPHGPAWVDPDVVGQFNIAGVSAAQRREREKAETAIRLLADWGMDIEARECLTCPNPRFASHTPTSMQTIYVRAKTAGASTPAAKQMATNASEYLLRRLELAYNYAVIAIAAPEAGRQIYREVLAGVAPDAPIPAPPPPPPPGYVASEHAGILSEGGGTTKASVLTPPTVVVGLLALGLGWAGMRWAKYRKVRR